MSVLSTFYSASALNGRERHKALKLQMLHGPPLSFLPTPVIFCRSYRRSMTRQLLHRHNIHPSIKEVRAKRAPEVVGTKGLHPSEKRPSLHNLQHTILRHPPPLNFSPFPNRVQQRPSPLSPQLQPLGH